VGGLQHKNLVTSFP